MRIANEWGITQEEVLEKVSSLSTHDHGEFKFLQKIVRTARGRRYCPLSVCPGSIGCA